jgi:hypothetical protein
MKKRVIGSVAILLGAVLGLTLYFDVGARMGAQKAWATVYQSISDADQTFPFPNAGVAGTGTKALNGWYIGSSTPEGLFGTGGVSHAGAALLGGYALPGANGVGPVKRPFTFVALTGAVTVASGGGAGTTVITLTDGTNTCTFTIPCNSAPPAGSNAQGGIRIAAVNGSGTGCVYPPGAVVTASVTTGTCTTTQPTIFDQFEGWWQ